MLLLSPRGVPCKMPHASRPRIVLPLSTPILQTTLTARSPDRQGKVRDIYDFGDRLLIVASDRISAFDYVLGSGIPDKGKVLTQISAFWFDRTRPIVDNHVLSTDATEFPGEARRAADLLSGRAMLVRRTEPLPIEERIILIDEVLTPDSSRFWPRDSYQPGGAQPSFDKQFVRDYLERIRWNKQPPVPSLPDDVVMKTREKYVEAFRRLTGRELV